MLVIDDDEAEAEAYRHTMTKAHSIRCSIKVSFPNAGLYISGITVEPSPKHPEKGLWVQMPRYKAGKKWVFPLECNQSYPFWELVHNVAVRAYEEYLSDNSLANYENADESTNADIAPSGFEPP